MVKSEAYLKLFELMRKYVYRYSSEPFILASGKQSNHYFNCKEITLHPDRLSILASYLVKEHIPSFLLTTPKSVGGLTLGADPISYAISLAYYQNEKIVYPLVIRKEAKGHGTGKKIEGVGNQKSCLVVDDVITTGGSTIQAVESLREAGIKVEQGICILDREEGGYEALFEKGIKMFPIFRKSDFI